MMNTPALAQSTALKNKSTQTEPQKTPIAKKDSNSKKKKNQAPKPESLPFPENVRSMAGSGAVLVIDNHAKGDEPSELLSLNPDKDYVPASILKLVTSAAALVALGPNYHFKTEFYVDNFDNLWVKGYGDPYLVSEELCLIVDELIKRGLYNVHDIYIDSTFFEDGVIVDGSSFTINPYDAYNTAFGVNFNTVSFLIDTSGKIVESNDCTPLTPIALELANKNFPKRKKRKSADTKYLNISESPEHAIENAGQVLRELLLKKGVVVSGNIAVGAKVPSDVQLFYQHISTMNLQEMIKELLNYSNNFMTNQIYITMGAEVYGPPGNFEKGTRVVDDFLEKFNLPPLILVEGSGLSRNNKLTARQMSEILRVMEPVRTLIKSRDDGSVYYKTGTMTDIQTLAGYIERPGRPDEPLTFVILLNGKYATGTRERILNVLKAEFVDKVQSQSQG
ncbi:MAG: D-alanyl-D-alanine carboxypeptidase [Deltaproteobacteria bacterium]|jgi:D-alanyl-D-alanine carboxypeptidase/D-alanyl-D-alanine-endopeptidase (penicillin-binding protein 4)|nr:D-alanyl-D-alanine carboxypeptidase [Deltaproteobacteria bacterium]